MEENESYAVGHFALGYIFGRASAKITRTEINIPVVLMLSVLPDVDIIIEQMFPVVQHRGPVHSIIVLSIFFLPAFIIYGKKGIPYFLALIQHPLVGDFVAAGPVQLLWPLSVESYGFAVGIESTANIALEWVAFGTLLIMMLKTKDVVRFFQPCNLNLILIIPTITVLLPTFLAVPLNVPVLLIPPHLFFAFLFLAAILINIREFLIAALS